MTAVDSRDRDGVRVITLDNPPVNALSFAYSASLLRAVQAAEENAAIHAVVFAGANGIFSAGVDVNDFNSEITPQTITIRDVIAAVEMGRKTYIAAVEGTALGGALELALACDYRVAAQNAKVGLPEIKLGFIPGAGGTQRLPRLIGAQPALEMMLKGETVKANEARKRGILDEVVTQDVVQAAIELASRVRDAQPKRRVSERKVELGAGLA
ncbi:MAG: enoyl-CoA hydratase/isomerase family protein, partial [Candidatus Eremiobacteraeota bacterium]|nr:enoyl-CoA hydratase/isomerase family protein [Candidatus Eremiobacteraeota bacterium]